MYCDDARAALLDGLDRPGAPDDTELGNHLESCADCQALREDIQAMRARVRVWHDLEPPHWPAGPLNPAAAALPRPAAPAWRSLLQQWLPLAASSLALVLALSSFISQGPAQNAASRPSSAAPAAPGAADPRPNDPDLLSTPAAQALLAASRRERQREMEALATLLKAELDRQKAQTEDSLEYLLAHQLQSARRLEDLQSRRLQPELRTTETL